MKSIFSRDESKKNPQLKRENAKDCWPGVRKFHSSMSADKTKEAIPDPGAVPEAPPRGQKRDSNAGLHTDEKTDPAVGHSMNED